MTHWHTPHSFPVLTVGTLDIWRVQISVNAAIDYVQHLPASEIQEGLRFKFPELQQRFFNTRYVLRFLLGRYLAIADINKIQWERQPQGKPYLADDALQFNVSHSGHYALLAFTRMPGMQLGIDIEKIAERDNLALAKRFFMGSEYQQLCALPVTQQTQAFYHIWVQKEAFIKATGTGLSHALDQFEVAVTGMPRVFNIANPLYSDVPWHSYEIAVASDYAACCTTSTPMTEVRYFDFFR